MKQPLLLACLLACGSAQAVPHVEQGDAGNAASGAQTFVVADEDGLSVLVGKLAGPDDLDFYRFRYEGAGELRIDGGPYYGLDSPFPDNPLPGFQVFLADGTPIGGGSSLDADVAGGPVEYLKSTQWGGVLGVYHYHFRGLTPGDYLLRVDGAGQFANAALRYVGDYELRFSLGTVLAPVPEPSSALLMFAGLGLLLGTRVLRTAR